MALNRYMHPRNPYKAHKPDFKALALKYEAFRKHATQDLQGRIHLDFKKPESLRALSWALMKEDFNLDVDMPLDRLIPTVPLRLNYVLWLEDIVGQDAEDVRGIDIGTGASCVYPLLGARKNGWSFLATEVDSYSAAHAAKNVETNSLQDKIKIIQVTKDAALCDILPDSTQKYAFCMSNPPFFGSNLEAWGMTATRSEKRPESNSVSTASPVESIYPGGEVQFVKQMIQDSLRLREQVRFLVSLRELFLHVSRDENGDKNNYLKLCQEEVIDNVGTSEFCQGRTMRWGLAWTFDQTLTFPKPPSKLLKSPKKKGPIAHAVPNPLQVAIDTDYSVVGIAALVQKLLTDLKIELEPQAKTSEEHTWNLTIREQTWTHQRRKRRLQMKTDQEESSPTKHSRAEAHGPTAPEQEARAHPIPEEGELQHLEKGVHAEALDSETKAEVDQGSTDESSRTSLLEPTTGLPSSFLFKCTLTVKRKIENVWIEMEWREGENKELMHQVLQFLKNRVK